MRKMSHAQFIMRDLSGFIEGIFKTHKEGKKYATVASPRDGTPRFLMKSPVEWYINGELITETVLPKVDQVTGMKYWGINCPITKEQFAAEVEKAATDFINRRKEYDED